MSACFKKDFLWALVQKEVEKNGEIILNQGQITEQEAIECPFCRQKSLKFIGHIGNMGEAIFRCQKCLLMAGIDDLSGKEKTEVIAAHLQALIKHCNNTLERFTNFLNAVSLYKP